MSPHAAQLSWILNAPVPALAPAAHSSACPAAARAYWTTPSPRAAPMGVAAVQVRAFASATAAATVVAAERWIGSDYSSFQQSRHASQHRLYRRVPARSGSMRVQFPDRIRDLALLHAMCVGGLGAQSRGMGKAGTSLCSLHSRVQMSANCESGPAVGTVVARVRFLLFCKTRQ